MNYPPVYVICVPGLPDRTEYATKHLTERGVPHTIWWGFPGVAMGLATDHAYLTDGHVDRRCEAPGSMNGKCGGQLSYHLGAGTVAVTLSHLALLKHIIAAGHERALILENDVQLPEDFSAKFAEFYGNLPPQWDMAYLDWLGGDHANAKPVVPGISIIPGGAHGTDAYMVTAKAARFLDQHCAQAWRPIDVSYMVEAAGYGQPCASLRCYYATPQICTQLTASGRLAGSLHFDASGFTATEKPKRNLSLFVRDSTSWDWLEE